MDKEQIEEILKKFDKTEKTLIETTNELCDLFGVSNCLHENQVMRQGDGDVYHQCLDCCELLE